MAFAAQHVRFHPTDFAAHMSMRVGVQGCALQSEGFVCDCEEGWRNVDPFSLATSCGSRLCSTQFTSGVMSGMNVSCDNDGTCLQEFDAQNHTFCECPTGFTGPFCNFG